ncbi:MAG: ureidoglycolate dehydrogenase, partial [Candidatus Adiutrix sp.]|nr:ureidoglycolate dehydrogenase [Candidatus Adiutrix sp.]
ADHLAYADALGVHSHGSVRVEYYAERIFKGGSNTRPNIKIETTGPCSAVVDGDNAVGFVVANLGMRQAIAMAKDKGVAVVGMKRLGHCGALSYYLRQAAAANMVGLSMCQSDPMVVPHGGAQAFFGTNPIGFACPVAGETPIVFDMATTVQAWGKVLDARARKKKMPDDWAVDKDGRPTTDPFALTGLRAVAGAKGYGLMMMVDILSGTLLGQPFGPHVTSMYAHLDQGRELGQLHIVVNPAFFGDPEAFTRNIGRMVRELHESKPALGQDRVIYPGERSAQVEKKYRENGIPIVREIYEYLISDDVFQKTYELGDPFAVRR